MQKDPKDTRISARHLFEIVENSLDTITIIEEDGTIRYKSPSVKRMLGYEQAEIGGKQIFDFIHPEDWERVYSIFLEVLAKEGSMATVDYRFRHKDGTYRLLQSRLRNLMNNDIGGILVNSRDLSDMKEAEGVLQESKTELERNVLERTQELSEVNNQLLRSLREKDVLLNEIHHRVKNNLQIISSLINLGAREGMNKSGLRDLQNRLKAMALVHEKLYQSSDMTQINFGDYARSLTTYIQRSMVSGTAVIRMDVGIQEIFLDVNSATSLGLILNELVTNAFEHGFEKIREGRVSVVMSRSNHRYTLTVSNNGEKPTDLDLNKVESLGLSLVVSLVEQLDGKIELGTKDDVRFKITLPVKKK